MRGTSAKKKTKASLEHHLVTVDADRMHVHAYLMCDERRCVEQAIEAIMDRCEKAGVVIWPPVVLVTNLGDAVDLVRTIMGRDRPDVVDMIAKATNFHLTIITMPKDDPDDIELMKLH